MNKNTLSLIFEIRNRIKSIVLFSFDKITIFTNISENMAKIRSQAVLQTYETIDDEVIKTRELVQRLELN